MFYAAVNVFLFGKVGCTCTDYVVHVKKIAPAHCDKYLLITYKL